MKIVEVCESCYLDVSRYATFQFPHIDRDDLTQEVFLSVLRFWQPNQEAWSREKVIRWLKRLTQTLAYREIERLYREREAQLPARLTDPVSCRRHNAGRRNGQGDLKNVTSFPAYH